MIKTNLIWAISVDDHVNRLFRACAHCICGLLEKPTGSNLLTRFVFQSSYPTPKNVVSNKQSSQ